TLLHARYTHRVAFLQAADVLKDDADRDRLGHERAAGEPEHEAREDDEPDQHQQADPDLLFIRYVHPPPSPRRPPRGSPPSRGRAPGTAAPRDPWTRGSARRSPPRGSSPATGAPPGRPRGTSRVRRATPRRSSRLVHLADAPLNHRSRRRSPGRAPRSARRTGDTWASPRWRARCPRAFSCRPTAPPDTSRPRRAPGLRAAGI